MGTPAINVDESNWTDGIFYAYSPETGKMYDFDIHRGQVASIRHRELKQAGASNPKDSKGWRRPASWLHTSTNRATCIPSYHDTVGYAKYDSALGRNVWVYNYYVDGGYGLSADVYGLPDFPNDLENAVINQALLKLKQQSSKGLNLGVAYAERRETAAMLGSACGKIADSVRRFRGARPKDWARLVRSAAGHGEGYDTPGAWLETQYGWNPLMQDIQDASYALDHTVSTKPVLNTIKSSQQRAIRDKYLRTTGYDNDFGWDCDVVGEHRCRVRLDYELDSALLATFSSLGLTNPAEIVCERLPYSFVVDWFIPVGDYLSIWDATLGWTFKGGTLSRKTKVGVTSHGVRDNLHNTGRYAHLMMDNGAQWNEHSEGYSRFVLTSSPMPRIPSFKDPISSKHIANAISLLVNAFR